MATIMFRFKCVNNEYKEVVSLKCPHFCQTNCQDDLIYFTDNQNQSEAQLISTLDKMAAISQTVFSDAFSWMKSLYFDKNFNEVCS